MLKYAKAFALMLDDASALEECCVAICFLLQGNSAPMVREELWNGGCLTSLWYDGRGDGMRRKTSAWGRSTAGAAEPAGEHLSRDGREYVALGRCGILIPIERSFRTRRRLSQRRDLGLLEFRGRSVAVRIGISRGCRGDHAPGGAR